MLSWLLSWIRSLFVRNEVPPGEGLYKPAQRRIYRYWNGRRVIAVDPMVIWTSLMDVGPELGAEITISASPSKEAPKARKRSVERLRKIFSVDPLDIDANGLLDEEVLELFEDFWCYCTGIKKNSLSSQTSVPESPISDPSSGECQPTPNTSDISSTAEEFSTGKQEPSSSEPPQHSD